MLPRTMYYVSLSKKIFIRDESGNVKGHRIQIEDFILPSLEDAISKSKELEMEIDLFRKIKDSEHD